MPSHFALSIRFLDPAFHGRRDGGESEWPPSPLRVFQSLVAAGAARTRRAEGLSPQTPSALKWLERQAAPTLVAPVGITGSGYRLSVPNNAMDIVARAWSRGSESNSGDANPATHRTMKTIRPTHLLGGDGVHYLWSLPEPLTDEVRGHVETLSEVARSVVAVGWGIDMVVAHGAIMTDEQAEALPGERWRPSKGTGGTHLRVPREGTFDALNVRYRRFLDRLGPDGFSAPPPLSTYATPGYRRATDPPPRPVAAFSLLKLDASGFRAFDTTRRALTIAGMVRHAARLAAQDAGWPDPRINAFVLGHGEVENVVDHVAVGPKRFAYLPLPSIEGRGEAGARVVGSVRRVLLSSFAEDCEVEIAWARRALSGQELAGEDRKPVALLSLLPGNDKVVLHYTRPASSWATVTPVVLPGHDDPAHYRRRLRHVRSAGEQRQLLGFLNDRVDALLRKAIVHSGFSQTLANHAELEWRKVGFWPGADLAMRYGVPDHLKRFPRFHVRLHWRDANERPVEVPGPVCLGGGRFYGLGLFAATT